MRKLAYLLVSVATVGALSASVLTSTADAATPAGSHGPSTEAPGPRAAADRGHGHLRVTRNQKGVEPGLAAEKITAHLPQQARGKVRFVLRGHGLKQARRIRVRNGRAVLAVPPLGTGTYHVRVGYRNLRGATSFRVYSAAVALDVTSFTISKSSYDTQYAAQLHGSVVFADGRPRDGYLDVYLDGNTEGGRNSPSFLGFTGIATDGTFDYSLFGQDVATHYPVGTYTFRAFYTPSPSFDYYVASASITVTVTA